LIYPISIQERLQEYYRRLKESPPASSATEGLELVINLLNEVEDELSGLPRTDPPPSPGKPDGRMYPPLADYTARNSDGSILARTKAHSINISADGSIQILNRRSQQVELEKTGARL
jgi:hypothetical protein